MSSSEIAKLESRWRENPQGLTFAPLAEAYRKMREIPRALEILAEGLGRHPDYIPASIVLGRCQLDLGDDVQAESAFSHVLELDDENVIALKALAEIAERQGRFDAAQSRLMTLLSVDRSNDEARIQLARIEELRVEAEASPSEAADADMELAGAEASDAASAVAGIDTDTAERRSPRVSETSGRVPAEEERVPTEAVAEDAPVAPAGAGIELEDNLQLDEDVEQLPDLVVDDLPEIASEAADAPVMDGLVGQDFREHSAEVAPLEDLAPGTASLDPVELGNPSDPVDSAGSLAEPDPFEASGAFEGSDSNADSDSPADPDALAASDSFAASDPFADRDALAEPEAMDEIQLEPSATNEFQLSSASDDWAESIGPGGGAEYQLPSAADELAAELSAEAEVSADDIPGAEGGSTFEEPGLRELGQEPAQDAGAGPESGAEDSDTAAPADDLESIGAEATDTDGPEPEASGGPEEGVAEPEHAAEPAIAADHETAADREPQSVAAADTDREPPPAAAADDEDGYPDPLEDTGDLADTDLIVTESMAELFLRQGHRGEALRVYRQLYQRSRDDLRLREKVDSLETELAEEAAAPPPRAPYEAPDTSKSVAAFLAGILDARPADGPPAWGTGAGAPRPVDPVASAAEPGEAAPTRPASDHLSLSAVFGEDGSPVPPASPSANSPSEEGISFDAFFGGDESGGAPRARAAAREDDDLDQFQNWLQNLKR